MTSIRPILCAAAFAFVLASAACSSNSDDEDNKNKGGSTATGGSGGSNGPSSGSGGSSDTAGSGGAMTATTAAGSGGASGSSGAAGAAGASGSAGCPVSWTGSPTRPQLDDASAECFTVRNYLAQSGTIGSLTKDDWDPTAGLGDASAFKPTYTVVADGSGTHTTVQAAIDAANASGSTDRVYILVKAGTYRELVCVKGKVPITLYGADNDASLVTIAYDNYNGKAVDKTHMNACSDVSSKTTYGTSGSTTFFVSSKSFQAKNLTIANDFAEGSVTENVQAVALTVQGDQAVFENVRFIGNQDTVQVKSPDVTGVSRSYFKNSYIEGDTDFIFGRGTAVFDGCTITYVMSRKNNSTHFAPSTESTNGFGFLVINSKITSDAASPTATTRLGRAWDDSSATSPNGQLVIRNSEIGAHILVATPWNSAATTGRAFDAATNRLYEYKNTGLGAAQ